MAFQTADDTYLVETEYNSFWKVQLVPATVNFPTSSAVMPKLDPIIVNKIPPLKGPFFGSIWTHRETQWQFYCHQLEVSTVGYQTGWVTKKIWSKQNLGKNSGKPLLFFLGCTGAKIMARYYSKMEKTVSMMHSSRSVTFLKWATTL